ncbi:LacI family DNA-binding transcriptional regulator [Devosia sp.]|uniref:LacI family DNA-binding transcriptional regulator n=1 Tax=Devosia sp. TaxID=1871048 RepID=UPI001B08C7B3|nr:LacI family DNA-binding transcriptional regulator [Devosia sp.]MBO9589825.1 LacI family DNA-binding transcriptional regulator [Devosia sp.]
MARKITINDVAAVAGVSRGAVTRALNDKADISQETKKKVLEVSARLGYRPSRFARNFAARTKTIAIGYVVASFRNPYYTDLAADILQEAKRRGWQVVITATEGMDEEEALELLSDQVDVIVGHSGLELPRLKLAARGLPVVLLERGSRTAGIHSLELDWRSGIKMAVEALYERGARHIGMIDSDYSLRANRGYVPSERRGYFEEFVRPVSRQAVVWGMETFAGGADTLRALLADHPETDAVLAFNDVMAIGAVQGAHALGIDVPGRLKILGVDGLSLGEAISPKLSSLATDRVAISIQALDIVEELSKHQFRELPSIHRRIEPKLVWRESA